MMTMKWKKGVALCLVALLCIASFAACNNGGNGEVNGNGYENGANGAEAPGLSELALDTVILEIEGGSPVLWGEFYYDLQNVRQQIEFAGPLENWGIPFYPNPFGEEMDFNEFAIRVALETALERRAVEALFHSLDETLDPEVYEELRESYLANFGLDDEGFAELLADFHLTEDVFRFVTEIALKYEQAFNALFGEGGVDTPQAEIDAFVEEEQILRAKHILLAIYTEEDAIEEGVEGDIDEWLAERNEQVRVQAYALYAELMALSGEAQIARFEEMLAAYGEDPGMLFNPDGYTFFPMVMVPQFSSATIGLANYEISAPARSGFGYHIILRLPVERDAVVMAGGNQQFLLSHMVAVTRMEETVEEMQEGIVYVAMPIFAQIIPGEIFG